MDKACPQLAYPGGLIPDKAMERQSLGTFACPHKVYLILDVAKILSRSKKAYSVSCIFFGGFFQSNAVYTYMFLFWEIV